MPKHVEGFTINDVAGYIVVAWLLGLGAQLLKQPPALDHELARRQEVIP